MVENEDVLFLTEVSGWDSFKHALALNQILVDSDFFIIINIIFLFGVFDYICLKHITLSNPMCSFSCPLSPRFLGSLVQDFGIVNLYSWFKKPLNMADRGDEFSFFQVLYVKVYIRINKSSSIRPMTTKFGRQVLEELTQIKLIKQMPVTLSSKARSTGVYNLLVYRPDRPYFKQKQRNITKFWPIGFFLFYYFLLFFF